MSIKPKDIALFKKIGSWILFTWLSYVFLTIIFSNLGKDLGSFGDSMGALNTLFSGLAFSALIVALYLQREDMSDTRGVMEKSADAQNRLAQAQESKNLIDTNALAVQTAIVATQKEKNKIDTLTLLRDALKDKANLIRENVKTTEETIEKSRKEITDLLTSQGDWLEKASEKLVTLEKAEKKVSSLKKQIEITEEYLQGMQNHRDKLNEGLYDVLAEYDKIIVLLVPLRKKLENPSPDTQGKPAEGNNDN